MDPDPRICTLDYVSGSGSGTLLVRNISFFRFFQLKFKKRLQNDPVFIKNILDDRINEK
jgi:hypothetical protein